MQIPLHGKRSKRLELWEYMIGMNPKGFRSPPTSDHNKYTHSKHPVTPLEQMYAQEA